MRADEDMLTIVVADDGTGSGQRRQRRRRGRARDARAREALGGTLTPGPADDGGWRVEAALPLAPARRFMTSVLLADDQALVRAGFRRC